MLKDLYEIIEQNSNQVTIKLSNKNHPVFKAHFPDFPILPGFLQIDIIGQILNDDIVSIKNSKFIGHIEPEDIIIYEIKKDANKTTIKIIKDTKKVSEIVYETK